MRSLLVTQVQHARWQNCMEIDAGTRHQMCWSTRNYLELDRRHT